MPGCWSPSLFASQASRHTGSSLFSVLCDGLGLHRSSFGFRRPLLLRTRPGNRSSLQFIACVNGRFRGSLRQAKSVLRSAAARSAVAHLFGRPIIKDAKALDQEPDCHVFIVLMYRDHRTDELFGIGLPVATADLAVHLERCSDGQLPCLASIKMFAYEGCAKFQ